MSTLTLQYRRQNIIKAHRAFEQTCQVCRNGCCVGRRGWWAWCTRKSSTFCGERYLVTHCEIPVPSKKSGSMPCSISHSSPQSCQYCSHPGSLFASDVWQDEMRYVNRCETNTKSRLIMKPKIRTSNFSNFSWSIYETFTSLTI